MIGKVQIVSGGIVRREFNFYNEKDMQEAETGFKEWAKVMELDKWEIAIIIIDSKVNLTQYAINKRRKSGAV